ncbi:MAG: S9 family peptidase [Flavobacteriales bacterium]|nr:S9 family peptidase [Flavobacteriales bacterium]NNK79953.1 S9 family peptidase [Flavobacteriales bacterium]
MNIKLLLFLFILVQSQFKLSAQEKLTNEDIWYSSTFQMDYVSGLESMEDGMHYTRLEQSDSGNAIVQYSYESGDKVKEIINSNTLGGTRIDDYQFSSDEEQLLIATGQERIYRHSSSADYLIYDQKIRRTLPLSSKKKGKVRLAEFSPDGSMVAFVRGNNLFYYEVATKKEVQVTSDGKINEIINGATDWVYEEEFGFDKGFYWSPNSDYLAYYRFDESEVKEFQMAMYGDLYPEQYTFKYPKAGEKNAEVEIHIYSINGRNNQRVDLGNEEHYVPRVKWTAVDGVLSITKMNRHQNHLELLEADVRSARGPIITPEEFYNEKSETYIEVSDDLVFLRDNQEFIMTSDKSGYNHIYVFNSNGKEVRQLTKGDWDVIEFAGYDEGKRRIFYSSSEEGPTEKNIYSVDISGTGKKRLSPQDGSNDANFSTGFRFYMVYHSDANTPVDIKLYNSDGREVRELVDNVELQKVISRFDFQQKEFFSFETERGDELNGWMIKPPSFDKKKKYPVLMAIYGGPGHNTVSNEFGGRNFYWHQMLAQKGYIVVSVDPRGTYYRGRDFKNSTYLQLGKLETEDMISSAKYLSSLSYVDGERIGMQGWSFGGYLTSSSLMKGAEHFKMGIAVAPVTNWRFYDTIYTERFMRTPQENPDGYDDNSPINHVERLEDPLLLVHGSADDNVHYQNSMEMVSALVAANKDFDLFIYPNRNHGIYGGTTRLHLFEMMTEFIEKNL